MNARVFKYTHKHLELDPVYIIEYSVKRAERNQFRK